MASKKRGAVVLTTTNPLPASEPDPDMDAVEAPKPPKKQRKPSAGGRRTPRLQAGGLATADRMIMAARDNGARAQVIVVTLHSHHATFDGAHQVVVAKDRSNADYQIGEAHTSLGFDEFTGLFVSDVCNPGLGHRIADMLADSDRNHVVVVDGTERGELFARLAALVAAHLSKMVYGTTTFWQNLPGLPKAGRESKYPEWQGAITKMVASRSETILRTAMSDYYYAELQHIP